MNRREFLRVSGMGAMALLLSGCGLTAAPVFCPIVAPYYAGMEVTVPLFRTQVKASPAQIVVSRSCAGSG